ncbi:uncharacterized protein METZ01_LOCUS194028 [marine metagenome]|uniref:Response regulatory domain-containing protein n=1 Tax=marine metagenome TaxID=408172 RepID=A0A382DTA9_9ZZZZ
MNGYERTRVLPRGKSFESGRTRISSNERSKQDAFQMTQMPHVLVVDDDRRLRVLLRDFLAENGFLVATADDAVDARTKLYHLDFDVIVLDVMMPGENGIKFMQELRIKSDIPILLLTAMDEIEDRIIGLESGADDYLAKPFEPRELVLRLNAVLRRAQANEIEDGIVIRFGRFSFNGSRGELYRDEALIKLTWGEIGLLRAFARQVGVAVSRDVLAVRMGVSPRTVDVQIARLRRKIESDLSHPHYLITVRGEGYVLRAD